MSTEHRRRLAHLPGKAATLVGVAATSLLLGISPASATASGTLTSGTTNPGVETHVGTLTGVPPFQEPCAIFTSYAYTVDFPTAATGSATVNGETFTTTHAEVNSAPGSTWAENGDGTYSYGPGPLPTCPPAGSPSDAIPGFQALITGTNALGGTLRCEADGDSAGTYIRTGLAITYDFTGYSCGTNGGVPDPNVHLRFDLSLIVVVPDPGFPPYPFGSITACTSPITPTACLSTGTLKFNP